jgi:hypothetical protein
MGSEQLQLLLGRMTMMHLSDVAAVEGRSRIDLVGQGRQETNFQSQYQPTSCSLQTQFFRICRIPLEIGLEKRLQSCVVLRMNWSSSVG